VSRVLVTGARGFIGRHTLAPLCAAGLEVHAVSSHEPSRAVLPPGDVVRWHHADLLDPGSAAALIRGVRPTHLLHLAWYTQPGVFWTSLANLDWLQASLSLLRAFGEAGGQRAVLAGTCAEYRWERHTHCVEGRTPVCPATLYGAAKHSLHVLAHAWARQVGVDLAWGRVFHLYGPHEHPDRLVSGVARALLHGEHADCTDGHQVRDFIYVSDLSAAFAALLSSDVTGPLNMASGEPVSVADVVAAVAHATRAPQLVRMGALPARPAEPERLTADVRRLREEVGWTPTVSLREGVQRTVEWWREADAGAGAAVVDAEARAAVSPRAGESPR
jgi:nucleoside-diphosphate-sugar epimerase